jgi:hypothetical protein
MFKELAHHVGVHIAQHPKEALATALTVGKAATPVVIAAAPYVAGAAIIGGIIYAICKD